MEYLLKIVALVVVTASAIAIHLARARKSCPAKANLPPGSLGLPVIGQTLSLARAMRACSLEQWTRDRIRRYGPVSKSSINATPTVLLSGREANKLVFFSSAMRMKQMESFNRVVGERNLQDLHGDDHRRVRGAVTEFLKPDTMKRSFLRRADAEVRRHLEENWCGRTAVTVQPLVKRLAFDMMLMASLVLGMEAGDVRDALAVDLRRVMEGCLFVIPVNLPFTAFSRSLKASRRARRLLEGITREKKAKLGSKSKADDLVSHLLSLRDHHGDRLVSDEEILHNTMLCLLAGSDTTSPLLTAMVRHLANDPVTLAAMAQEHEEIANNKPDGDALSSEDLSKMKFTWRVAQETLRIIPPSLGILRTTLEDVEFHGYCIPKGWQVFLPANATHMDPSIFHEPAKFDPSRFDKPTPPFSFLSFGGGPRLCPGMDISKIQTLVTMHYLVRHFTWKLSCKDNTFGWDPFPSMFRGLPINLDQLLSPSCLIFLNNKISQ